MKKGQSTSTFDQILEKMKQNPGCTIIGHRTGKGNCYRLRDSKVNPIMNITISDFDKLLNADYVIKSENVWILNN